MSMTRTQTQNRNLAFGVNRTEEGLQDSVKLKIIALEPEKIEKTVAALKTLATVVWSSQTIANDRGDGFHKFVLLAGGVLE